MTLIPVNISPAAAKDVRELRQKIDAFKNGSIPEERFKAFRLARGVYGQRQLGVQMFRIKIPFGKLTAQQLVRIADLAETYTNGNLHITTRQNIQLHFVKLDDTPEMWARLEELGVTTREACGNTVRNVTGSALAGIDPDEPFDVSPYARQVFQYFLRNPICQEMGRKVKIAFASSGKDSVYTYFNDFGFVPRIKQENGTEQRGFKVVIGGGLGAQSFIAPVAFDFLPEDEVIPFIEASLRVFDRYGEREKRFRARLKFLVDEKKGLGLQKFLQLVAEEQKAIAHKKYPVDRSLVPEVVLPRETAPEVTVSDRQKYEQWRKGNVFEQKQKGYYAITAKPVLGNLSAEKARALAALVKKYAANDIRMTVNQGFVLKFIKKEALPYFFNVLDGLHLAEPGVDTLADITACPGTDTCNLGVTNSTGIAEILEKLVREEYPHLVLDNSLHIKISGCMNSCGQHMAANIGLHGSSIKAAGGLVVPAMQVVLGGGIDPEGNGFIADKVIKLPTKKIPQAVRFLLDAFEEDAREGEYFNDFYQRLGKMHFYKLLKPLADVSVLEEDDFMDWGHSEQFVPEIGTGECAGVSFDVVATILQDAGEKLQAAEEALSCKLLADAVYHAYSVFVVGAKALLLGKDINCNTHIGIIRDFDEHFYRTGEASLKTDFENLVLQVNKHEPNQRFAKSYVRQAADFLHQAKVIRELQMAGEQEEKVVIEDYYKA